MNETLLVIQGELGDDVSYLTLEVEDEHLEDLKQFIGSLGSLPIDLDEMENPFEDIDENLASEFELKLFAITPFLGDEPVELITAITFYTYTKKEEL